MSRLDPQVANLLDTAKHDSDDEDALIESLEDSPAIDAFREQRIQQLHAEFNRAKAQKSEGFGNYTEIKEENQLMQQTTSVKRVIVHFAKDDFQRCRVMDRHLEALAEKHFDTKFIKMSVDNAPFLVTKLKVKVLPAVICFIDGVSVDKIVGFEGLGYTEETFTTPDLEKRLLKSGVVLRPKAHEDAGATFAPPQAAKEDSEDDDWD